MNFKWQPDKASLTLTIPEIRIDSRLVSYATNHGYEPKPELHVTLLSFQNGKKILQAVHHNSGMLDEIFGLAQTLHWPVEYLPEYYVLERTIPEFSLNGKIQTPQHTRRTIIQKIVAPSIVHFMNKVSVLTGVSFADPFPHITLFSWSDYAPEMTSGIGLNSEEDFKKYFKETVVL